MNWIRNFIVDTFSIQNGFKNHVQKDHNKWNYIYYMIYLDRKYQTNPNEMTALEKQVYKPNQVSNNSLILHSGLNIEL